MAVMKILHWPDPVLATMAGRIDPGADLRALVADMFDTMYAAPGRGLAGPQVGVLKRLFVMDCTWKEGEKSPRACLNPQITWRSEELVTREEGCLSIPGVLAEIARPAEVVMRWHDENWVEHEEKLSGFEATCAQHELDHLDGRVYLDYLSDGQRTDLLAAYEAAQ